MKPTIRVIISHGELQSIEFFPGTGSYLTNDVPNVMVWDYDCEDMEGKKDGDHVDGKGEEFLLSVYTPKIIKGEELLCDAVFE